MTITANDTELTKRQRPRSLCTPGRRQPASRGARAGGGGGGGQPQPPTPTSLPVVHPQRPPLTPHPSTCIRPVYTPPGRPLDLGATAPLRLRHPRDPRSAPPRYPGGVIVVTVQVTDVFTRLAVCRAPAAAAPPTPLQSAALRSAASDARRLPPHQRCARTAPSTRCGSRSAAPLRRVRVGARGYEYRRGSSSAQG